MGLQTYREKRDFRKTREPRGAARSTKAKNSFVIQKHDASHLHYDFRLELDGVLKSWAVPKGPSLDPSQKRLAMEVEDHPIDYADFEGEIPKGEYGGGEVIVWDQGSWIPKGDPRLGLRKGRLEFELRGEKLRGAWILVRTRPSAARAQWLLMKRHDAAAISESKYDVTQEIRSVLSGSVLGRDSKGSSGNTVLQKLGKKVNSRYGRKITGSKPLRFVEPQLAQLATEPPSGPEWIHEIKFDGYRTLCAGGRGKRPRFYSRKGLDWTEKYPDLIAGVESLPAESLLLDGEIVVPDENGKSDFLKLVSALKEKKTEELVYYVFDLLHLNGEDLRPLPLIERKQRLKALLDSVADEAAAKSIVFSDHWDGSGKPILRKGCELGLEGIISKDSRQPYTSGRGLSWIKSKCIQGQEFIVAGYTSPGGSRMGFGAVLLGAYTPDGTLRYVGKVGTGFNREEILSLLKRFTRLKSDKAPFSKKVPKEKNVTWMRPEAVIDVQFRGWTSDGLLRQGAYHGLRLDKPAREVTIDVPVAPEVVAGSDAEKLTHPEKVLISEGGITKKDIRDYLQVASPWMLPHVEDRPLALLRCPDGVEKECFFQKNLHRHAPAAVHTQPVEDSQGKKGGVLYIESREGLLSLAQMGTLELHVWGAHRGRHLWPDLVVFDLDPDPDVPVKKVGEAALRLRAILKKLGLVSFLKVSGGKGMHVHVPIEPRYSWDQVKEFSRAIARQLVDENPELYLATMTKAKRRGKIFIDYFRNGYGATSVAPYSVRARSGGPVAIPIAWSEALKVKPNGITLRKALRILKKRKTDPWKDYFKVKQRIALLESTFRHQA